MEMLRLATAGSVDDGKSTLIGRLLHDSRAVLRDQLEAVARASRRGGTGDLDLALLTDGLRAEREQGITIDVAYRYFATARRKFIIADTPGHVQYTPNMVTGASTAQLAVVLVDARHGMTEQSRRHALICSLLGVPHLVVAVNKMDLVGYDEQTFRRIDEEFTDFSARLRTPDITALPISALTGHNVVTRSGAMPWYDGPTLLSHLEQVHVAADGNLVDPRFPVQCVIRQPSYRGYAGRIASGVLRTGDEVVVLPSGRTSQIAGIDTPAGPADEAFAPMSVTVRLTDDIDVSRGDVLARPQNQPHVTQDLDTMMCWMARSPLREGDRVLVKHLTRTVPAVVGRIEYRIDVNMLRRHEAERLTSNEIGRVRLRTPEPLVVDDYHRNRQTGRLIAIDPVDGSTLAGATIRLS
ncbi:sulfate adenylyltransferase subunit 1 [Micromonospora sp. KC723]|uniref:sulfate adenylyltransferase subunit 1 n=1 Tax=Micromonospora sp. KC723 TaxID=2530381 RepID=UPI001045D908|nr:GTP-binding protein [Micromonospora sp. KC723]TDB78275.1 sulfate adenylyltransferase [Micromonospora sp. KC723]